MRIAPPTDAFGRQRVSNPASLFDTKLIADAQPLIWDDAETSGGSTSSAHQTGKAAVKMSVGATTAGTRVRQTFQRFAYQPGKSQLVYMTTVVGTAATGITRRVGLFDDSDGVFLEQTSSGLAFVVRSSTSGSPVDTRVEQSAWEYASQADDTAQDQWVGHSVDASKAQIVAFDLEWLGVGTVRCGFVINGTLYWAHRFHHANSVTLPYTSNPNLPLRYEIVNDGTGAASDLWAICGTVISEGGSDTAGQRFTVDRGTTGLTTLDDGDLYPLLAIRLRSGYKFANVVPESVSITCNSTSFYRWALLLNPTVAGTALSYSTVANTAIEAATGADNATKVSGGTLLLSGYAEDTIQSGVSVSAAVGDIALGSSIAGTSDQLVLAVQRITGTTETFFGTLTWREQK